MNSGNISRGLTTSLEVLQSRSYGFGVPSGGFSVFDSLTVMKGSDPPFPLWTSLLQTHTRKNERVREG